MGLTNPPSPLYRGYRVGISTVRNNVISFCSGVGGLDLGVKRAMPTARTVCYVEREVYPISVLVSRIKDEALDDAPIWTDLKTFDCWPWRKCVDGIIGGYPCQPFSIAGRKQGADDPRHLWPFICEHIANLEPAWCFFENVANHLNIGFLDVSRDLQALGYRVAALPLAASDIGATHGRLRLFILAYSGFGSVRESVECEHDQMGRVQHAGVLCSPLAYPNLARSQGRGLPGCQCSHQLLTGQGCSALADSGCQCHQRRGEPGIVDGSCCGAQETEEKRQWGGDAVSHSVCSFPPGPEDLDAWADILEQDLRLAPALSEAETQSLFCGVADGMESRVDRLRAIGNGVVPAQAAAAFRILDHELTGGLLSAS